MKSVFDSASYKDFLQSTEQSRKQVERGFRRRLAEAVGCQSGYISQVLNTKAHFSLEQGLLIAKFLGLSASEQKFFLTLIEKERAGTVELSRYFANELQQIKEKHLSIKERVGDFRELTESQQSVYYSSWHYLAIHMICTIPGFNEPKKIAESLNLSDEVVNTVLLFLIQTGILQQKKDQFIAGYTQVHLSRESALIKQHHTNLRLSAVQSLISSRKSDVHYSTVSTLSKADVEVLRAKMIELIETYVATVHPSKEEELVAFNLDFYSLLT